MEKHSDEAKPQLKGSVKDFEDSMRHYMASFQTSQLLCAMNELSNHDHSRFMTRTNEKVGRAATLGTAAAEEGIKPAVFREAVVVQMTWPGAPTIIMVMRQGSADSQTRITDVPIHGGKRTLS